MVRKQGIVTLALVLLVAGCDGKPNSNFAKDMKNREASGDPYSELDSAMPRQQSYNRQRPGQERNYSANQAAIFQPVYASLVRQYAAGKDVDRNSALFKSCMEAFAQAGQYQTAAARDPDAKARGQALSALGECRRGAKAAGDKGKTLARFSSAGMVMIGATDVGRGDVKDGLATWVEGERNVAQDRPDFTVGLGSITTS
ncbi:hypothetical protein [Sphingomonas sp. OTU376]|uniref:hypothetical protein n=1 Tax=Sphingomonas sp. OTU376 TaxID=3043863 RepID=UPI00313AEE93